MSKYVFLFALLVVTAITALAFAPFSAHDEVPAAGAEAPSFKLVTNEGKEASLTDYKGQWVVLYFYPKDFTSGCTLQARNFQRDLAKYEAAKAVILGVSIDTAESHKEFCAKEGLNFKLLSDTDAKVSQAYGSVTDYNGKTYSARNTFIIDPQGKIAKVFLKVSPAGHSDEVLAALAELQKPAEKQARGVSFPSKATVWPPPGTTHSRFFEYELPLMLRPGLVGSAFSFVR